MTTPTKLREQVLSYAPDLIDLYGDAAVGKATFFATVDEARKEMFSLVKAIVLQAGDPVKAPISGKDADKKVSSVLKQVATGKLTPGEGEKLLSLIALGVEIVEGPKLVKLLEALKKK